MSDLSEFVRALTARGLGPKAIGVATDAFEEVKAAKLEKDRQRKRHVRGNRGNPRTAENLNEIKDCVRGNRGQSAESDDNKKESKTISELHFLSEDGTYEVLPDQFKEWGSRFGLKPERIFAKWRALYRNWLIHMPAEHRKTAFENKLAKDLRDKPSNVTPIRRDIQPGEPGYWSQKMKKR